MKKLFLLMVAIIVASSTMFGQNSMLATLSHGENITMFYGTYALRDAMNAAENGDIINLSGGAFQAVNITKAVTLRGTGIDDAAPTYINGSFDVNVVNDTHRLTLEGIRCTDYLTMKGTLTNPYFVKSQFNYINYGTASIKNAMIVNCRITSRYHLNGSSTAQFINSYVNNFSNYSANNTEASFINCVIKPEGDRNDYIINSQLLNTVIVSNKNYYLPSSSVATNCVSVNSSLNIFSNSQANTGCFYGVSYSDLFKDSQTLELTDDAKTKYLGNDGTQVGIYGGVLPYSSIPSYPRITKMNVANKTTADGKLSVEIEVSAAK